MSKPLAGKVALVTGGARGIGAAIAKRLAADGADVGISFASSAEAAKGVVSAIEAESGRGAAFRADAADPAQAAGLVSDVVSAFGHLDILVNNAGVYLTGTLGETTDADFDRVIAINVKAVMVASREASRVMGKGGRIITIGSVLGERAGYAGAGLYVMSKAAVAGFTRAWAWDLAGKGITVNAVAPGSTDTAMNPADGPDAPSQRAGIPLGQFGTPEEVAAAVAFLASPEAGHITGIQLRVDGGQSA